MSAGAATEPVLSSTSNSVDIPTRRILRRHEKTSNHEHHARNGLNDDHSSAQLSSTAKHQPLSKPYLERVSNYAETRARIFNETSTANTDLSNASMISAKQNKIQTKPNAHFIRSSYRKQHQTNSHQPRSYAYQHSQVATSNHLQQYGSGKTMDPSSHMLNASTTRSRHLSNLFPCHQVHTYDRLRLYISIGFSMCIRKKSYYRLLTDNVSLGIDP
jgi:hypothetical protein